MKPQTLVLDIGNVLSEWQPTKSFSGIRGANNCLAIVADYNFAATSHLEAAQYSRNPLNSADQLDCVALPSKEKPQ